MNKKKDKILRALEPYFLPNGAAYLTYTDGSGFYVLKCLDRAATAVRASRDGDASTPLTAEQVIAIKNNCRRNGRRFGSFGQFIAKHDERRGK